MKNVKKCSLSGIAFTMDTDAYEMLSAYMDSLRESCGHTSDGDEIVADIEARIAELILSTCSADSVVERPLVENIIKQMGSPEDISSESEPDSSDSDSGPAQATGDAASGGTTGTNEPRIPRRLYRDMENAKLGGVCTGLACYFNTDPVWVRLLFLLPLLLTPMSGVAHFFGPLFFNMFVMFILAYIVMWFVVPAARSARQRLEMKGERITAQSIKDATMAGAATDADSEAKPVVANVVTVFGQIILILLKIFAGIIVFGLIIAACIMIIGIMVVAISGSSELLHFDHTVLISSLGISVGLVPTMLLIYVLMCLIASRKPGGKTVLVIFILWVIAIVSLIAAALYEYNSGSFLSRHGRDNHHQVTVKHDSAQELENAQQAEVVEIVEVSDTAETEDSAGEATNNLLNMKVATNDVDNMKDVTITFEKDSMRFSISASAPKE